MRDFKANKLEKKLKITLLYCRAVCGAWCGDAGSLYTQPATKCAHRKFLSSSGAKTLKFKTTFLNKENIVRKNFTFILYI